MKNKEIEEILFDMDLIANHDKVPIYFTQNKVKLLLSYIEQLENNRDKAIELLNELSNLYNDNYTVSDKAKDIINILKGDSDV